MEEYESVKDMIVRLHNESKVRMTKVADKHTDRFKVWLTSRGMNWKDTFRIYRSMVKVATYGDNGLGIITATKQWNIPFSRARKLFSNCNKGFVYPLPINEGKLAPYCAKSAGNVSSVTENRKYILKALNRTLLAG